MPDYTNNILLTGYWPPTNEMLRGFRPRRLFPPRDWKGRDWRGHGFDVFAFFPEFDGPEDEVGVPPYRPEDVGHGDFKVNYKDTKEDWERITRWLRPCAIITFSRGHLDNSWEIEEFVHNWGEWDTFPGAGKPDSPPPDDSKDPGEERRSTLPMESIRRRVNSASHLDVRAFKDSRGAGDLLSGYIGYLGVWYQAEHGSLDADGMCFAAGHIHVGGSVPVSDATEATEITLEALIDHIKPKRPTTWISEIGFLVWTKHSVNAGTEDRLTVDIYRDGEYLFSVRLSEGLERGDAHYYNFPIRNRYFDESEPPQPPGVLRHLRYPALYPPPRPASSPSGDLGDYVFRRPRYPASGIEFSNGVAGNLGCRFRIHGDDKWIKDQVDVYVKEIRPGATGIDWVEDDYARHLGSWREDVPLSTYSDEGFRSWTLYY